MNRDAQYFILCEDKQTQCFLRYFLTKHLIKREKIRCLPLPIQGSGERTYGKAILSSYKR